MPEMQSDLTRAREIAEALIGTAQGAYDTEANEWLEDATPEELAEFDSIVFMCAMCNWWCAADEEAENDGGANQVCDECFDEDEGEFDDG